MQAFIDLTTNKIIQGVNNRESLLGNMLEVKRGDTGGIDWYFVQPFVGVVEIDDNGSNPDLPLSMRFGAKLPGDYPGGFLLFSDSFSKVTAGTDKFYRMPVSLNTSELNDELVDGVVSQTVADSTARLALTGLLVNTIVGQSADTTYWRLTNAAAPSDPASWEPAPQKPYLDLAAELEVTLDGRIFSTTEIVLRVANDVVKGGEGVPTTANPSYPAPALVLSLNSQITTLTGGGTDALDGIVTVGLSVPRIAVLCLPGGPIMIYVLEAGTAAESSPATIRPDDYNGSTNAKVWQRKL